MKREKFRTVFFILLICSLISCKSINYDNIPDFGRQPLIEPDYAGVTIPVNIAPTNFKILEEGSTFHVIAGNFRGMKIAFNSKGIVRFPASSWHKLVSAAAGDKIQIEIISEDKDGIVKKYDPFFMNVAHEPVDPYLCYRLLYPGYESWSGMKIVQRATDSFKESSVIENQMLDNNCVNCHSFCKNDPEKFLIHVRGSLAGTYFAEHGKVRRLNLRTPEMPANAVYPSWHPSGRYVAFSSTKIIQSIHMSPEKDNEFYDVFSALLIYDIEKNEMSRCGNEDSAKYMETYPCWSPDGNFIYYCRTEQVKAGFDYRKVKYDLVRRPFDQLTGSFGNAQVIFDAHAINKSVSLPSVSPDGLFLIFALHDCGSFPVWHKEADLYLYDLKSGETERMSLNSSETESWHSWSSNGKWLVFSSKRGDGLTSRPYFAYFGSAKKVGKPFILPQRDPELYERTPETFNRPEFVTGKIKTISGDFARASGQKAVKALWRR